MSTNKSKTASPTRRSQTINNNGTNKTNIQLSIDNSRQDFVLMDKDLLRGLSEKEVEIEHLKTTVIGLNTKVEVIRDMEQDVVNSQTITKNSEIKRVELQTFIKTTSIQIQEDAQKNKQFQDSVINENNNLQQEVLRLKQALIQKEKERLDQQQRYETIISERELRIKTLIEENLQQLAKIREQEQIIRLNEDIADQLAQANKLIEVLTEQKRKLQQELETASDYILALEDKVYKANKTSLELLRQLKDAEIEIETLKNYIIELKQRIAVYIPVKDDVIDKKLAEFINNYPDRQKLKIMFLRESEGVYQFGSKRVAVRVDKDKINIRVGGGYLSIDEFLDQYTPAELDKMERKDPLKKFSEKIAMQKTLVGKEVRESSPIRSPTRQ
ncbi:gas2 domain containing protein [Stylonychia lemnae]|uniref:Gas2 domain containing protein n=1 Tax=Stylonychia lemnae TaxID=5949 RepID=A0A078AUB8_STYLE|nr:gas2 domain containing protein [Stylonychia lemnae]|eukprot:CDW85596.1 gas2 domain containing protein [Stylonychia lemnae]